MFVRSLISRLARRRERVYDALTLLWLATLICSFAALGWMTAAGASLNAIIGVGCVAGAMSVYTLCLALLGRADEDTGEEPDDHWGGGRGPDKFGGPDGPSSGGLQVDWDEFIADFENYARAHEHAVA